MAMKWLERFEENVLAFLLMAMTILVFMEVVLRFGFNTGLLWAQELTLHISAWFVLIGAAYGVKVGAHIGVDAVVRLLPPTTKRIVSLIAVVACLIYCGLFLFGSWGYLSLMYESGEILEDIAFPHWMIGIFGDAESAWDNWRIDFEEPLMPSYMAHSVLILGFGMLAYRFVQAGIMFATGRADSFHHADEAEEALELEKQLEAEMAEEADAQGTEDTK